MGFQPTITDKMINRNAVGWASQPTTKPQGLIVGWVSNPPLTPQALIQQIFFRQPFIVIASRCNATAYAISPLRRTHQMITAVGWFPTHQQRRRRCFTPFNSHYSSLRAVPKHGVAITSHNLGRARNDDLGFRQPERFKINAYRRCWWVFDPPYGVSYIFQAA